METPTTPSPQVPNTVPAQEKLSAALSYILFFIPIVMEKKTEYTLFHMRQSFGLLCIMFVCSFLSFLPLVGILLIFIMYACMALAIFLAWQAYLGNKFNIDILYTNTSKLITFLKLDSIFSI